MVFQEKKYIHILYKKSGEIFFSVITLLFKYLIITLQLILKLHSHYLIATNNLELDILKHKTHILGNPVAEKLNQENMNEFDLEMFWQLPKSEVMQKHHSRNPYLNT